MLSRFFSNKQTKVQVGIAENSTHRCWVWHEGEQLNVQWQTLPAELESGLQGVRSWQKSAIVRPIPQNYIWQKSGTLSWSDESTLYKQIIQLLNQELPIALQDVYFDYRTQVNAEQNIAQISLYAVRKHYADSLMLPYPTILDCESHCYQRGLAHLLPENTDMALSAEQLDDHLFPENTLDKSLYLTALGASLWNGKG